MSPPSVRTRGLIGAAVIGAILAVAALVSPSALLGSLESVATDPYLFGLVVVGLYLGRPLVALPTTPLAVVVGYGYGVGLGVPIALLGVAVTVVPPFLVARWLAGDATDPSGRADSSPVGSIESVLERAVHVVDRYYETAGPIRGVVASRLAPIPSDVATCAAAISGVRLRQLVVGTVIGELPWTVAAVVVGASAATIRTDGLGELSVAVTLACLVAAAVLLAGPAYRALRTRRGTQNASRPADS
ncbi:VTT domain-containing protein [Natronolimnohabitans sp. A-GB9]|uniref:TVP38/TMEM64 family protein n=1 Tax=Natronolimnohabitans sp. A-GB9 TaxID=3069757 RepID=UPI0027B189FF|nr:VTT domain-containing protein [Natronolimnohabitans sp. A-GB9]MDQ2051345.1 VTT domain-containing protein [Natronolimnohabitans sp. A-GB9]